MCEGREGEKGVRTHKSRQTIMEFQSAQHSIDLCDILLAVQGQQGDTKEYRAILGDGIRELATSG